LYQYKGETILKWSLVCFDLDNTLFSYEDVFEKAMCYCFDELKKNGLQNGNELKQFPTKEIFNHFKHFSDIYWGDYENHRISRKEYRRIRFLKTMEVIKYRATEQEADQFHERYNNVMYNYIKPYHGVIPLLKKLQKIGVTIGVITNGSYNIQFKKIEKIKISPYISKDHLFVSEELGIAKPNKHIFDIVRRKCGKDEKKPLFIGDAWDLDILGAMNAGWDAIYLNTRNEPPTTDHVPYAIIEKFEDLWRYMK
jgi:5'-nucleotidase